MPPPKKKRKLNPDAKPGIARSYLNETFCAVPAGIELLNGHVLYLYLLNDSSVSKTERAVKEKFSEEDRSSIPILSGRITSLVQRTLKKFKKLKNEIKLPSSGSNRATNMTTRRRFIIDTDCGLDDAQAILMAISQDVDIVGITTCSGNTGVDQVCRNVLRVMKLANKLEIPVYRGTSASLLRDTPPCTAYHGEDGLGDVPDPTAPDSSLVKEEHAVNALVRMINENAGDATLVCLGPLTNIALAIQMDPTIGKKLTDCHIMGGNYEAKGNITVCGEFNFRADPEAASIVLNQLGCPITLVCWELCLKYHLTWDEYKELRSSGTEKSKFLHTAEKGLVKFSLDSDWPYLPCDEVCMATALQTSVVTKSEHVYCTLELGGEYTRGQMVVDWRGFTNKTQNVKLVLEINTKKYFEMMKKTVE